MSDEEADAQVCEPSQGEGVSEKAGTPKFPGLKSAFLRTHFETTGKL